LDDCGHGRTPNKLVIPAKAGIQYIEMPLLNPRSSRNNLPEMTKPKKSIRKARAAPRRKTNAPLRVSAKRIIAVAEHAIRKALREHKRAGNPIAVWQDGKVVMLGPEEIEA
jgi:hypothetical protein